MNLVKRINALKYSKTFTRIKAKSPEILLGLGLIAGAAAMVTACRATLKADEVLNYHKEKIDEMDKAYQVANSEEFKNDPEAPVYDEDLYLNDRKAITMKTAVRFFKLFALPLGLSALSVTCILASRNILNKRYVTVVGMYNGLLETFNLYRQRVRDEVGEIMDRHYMYGTEIGEITEETVDENGKKKKEKRQTENVPEIPKDNTSRVFAEGNKNWDSNPVFNLMFLRSRMQIFTDKLMSGQPVFLNEVYDELGFDLTTEGAFIGWLKDDPNCDNCVDFGIYRTDSEQAIRFVNGDSNSVLLEFNHCGIIVDKLDEL